MNSSKNNVHRVLQGPTTWVWQPCKVSVVLAFAQSAEGKIKQEMFVSTTLKAIKLEKMHDMIF